jgi:hypothetical protein
MSAHHQTLPLAHAHKRVNLVKLVPPHCNHCVRNANRYPDDMIDGNAKYGSSITVALRTGLWLLFVPSGLFAIYMLFVGLTFGFALWNPTNPLPTLLWFGVLTAPVLIATALMQRQTSSAMLAMSFIAACIFDVAWILLAVSH